MPEGRCHLNAILSDLVRLLEEEAALHQDLLSTVTKEREILRRFAVEELYENNKTKETLILKVRLTEQACQSLIAKLDQSADSPLTLIQVAELAPEPWKSRLLALRAELTALVEEIMSLNNRNRFLIQYTQNNLNHLYSLITFYGGNESTYDEEGRTAQGTGSGLLISHNV
jgi:flagellar biosynthesis/type III secretory pathway chaperone